MRKPKKKWQRSGYRIRSTAAFNDARRRRDLVYVDRRFRGKPITIKWVANMAFAQVLGMIEAGSIEIAGYTPEYRKWLDFQEIPF